MALLDAFLPGIATIANSFLDQTATITARGSTPDSTGGTGEDYTGSPKATGVPCMVRPGKGTGLDALIANQLQAVNMYLIRMPLVVNDVPLDVEPFDQITVNGTKYQVRGTNGSENSDAVQIIAYCVEYQST